ncbi:extracellular solute-binding protein [Jeotgalibaca porci]|uniref:ABC transporter substrate-binding protein n=1 Tax=Jeotgalibaca porci TaxID=1868793 RepID=UPI0035A0992E
MKRLFLGLASVLVLAACGNGDTAGSGDSADKVKIRFSTWDSESSLDAQQALVDKFNDSQEDIEVLLEGYGGEYDTKITAGMGAGDAPDVMYMWNYPAYSGGLEPLDSYIESEGADYKENFYETTWNYNSIDDTVYGIPVGFTTHALYYNKDLFDAAGVDYPTNDWTWDDVREASEKISNADENVYGYIMPGKPDPYDFEMYLWSNDTAYASEDGETTDGYVNSPEAVGVLQTFQDMMNDNLALASESWGTDEFSSQTAAMVVSGAWDIGSFNEAGLNFGTAAIPSFEGQESKSVLSSSGLAISADSKNKDAAWEFVKFWTNEEANIERIDYELSVLKSVVDSEGLEEDEYKSVFYEMLERSSEYGPSSFNIENWSDFADQLSMAFEQVFNPTTRVSPQEALDSVVK